MSDTQVQVIGSLVVSAIVWGVLTAFTSLAWWLCVILGLLAGFFGVFIFVRLDDAF